MGKFRIISRIFSRVIYANFAQFYTFVFQDFFHALAFIFFLHGSTDITKTIRKPFVSAIRLLEPFTSTYCQDTSIMMKDLILIHHFAINYLCLKQKKGTVTLRKSNDHNCFDNN